LAHFKLRRRWWTAAALTLVVGGLSIWATAHFRQTPNHERSFSLQIASPDGSDFAFGANSSGISLSLDGKMAAYIAAAPLLFAHRPTITKAPQ
jgi:hypothetical protein